MDRELAILEVRFKQRLTKSKVGKKRGAAKVNRIENGYRGSDLKQSLGFGYIAGRHMELD